MPSNRNHLLLILFYSQPAAEPTSTHIRFSSEEASPVEEEGTGEQPVNLNVASEINTDSSNKTTAAAVEGATGEQPAKGNDASEDAPDSSHKNTITAAEGAIDEQPAKENVASKPAATSSIPTDEPATTSSAPIDASVKRSLFNDVPLSEIPSDIDMAFTDTPNLAVLNLEDVIRVVGSTSKVDKAPPTTNPRKRFRKKKAKATSTGETSSDGESSNSKAKGKSGGNSSVKKKARQDSSTSDDMFIDDDVVPSNVALRPRPESRTKLDDSGASDNSVRDGDWSKKEVCQSSTTSSSDESEAIKPVGPSKGIKVSVKKRDTSRKPKAAPQASSDRTELQWAPRHRQQTSDKKRAPTACPVPGCPCQPTRLVQHLRKSPKNPFHQQLSKQEMDKLIERIMGRKKTPVSSEESRAPQTQVQQAGRSEAHGKCPLCDWRGPRFYRHLDRQHKDFQGDRKALMKQARDAARDVQVDTVADTVLDSFQTHLMGLEGGMIIPDALPAKRKEEKSVLVKLHVGRVRVVMKHMLGEQFKVSDLGRLRHWAKHSDEGGCVDWLRLKRNPDGTPKLDSRGIQLKNGSGHIQNIAASLVHFHRFLSQRRVEYGIDRDDLEMWRDAQSSTMKSLKTEVSTEYHLREDERASEVIPLFMLAAYMQSDYMRNARNLMDLHIEAKKKDPSLPFNKEVHSVAVRSLALALQLLNYKRTGPLSDFRIKELNDARLLEKEDDGQSADRSGRIVTCRIHSGKTYKAHGVAQVAMPETFAETLKEYCRYIRPNTHHLSDSEVTDYVFVYQKGSWMDSSEMNKQLNWAWREYCATEETNEKYSVDERALFAGKLHINSNILRRSIVTHFREKEFSEEGKAFLAKHMDHRLETADGYYNMSYKDRATTVASDLVACMFRKEILRINDRGQKPTEPGSADEAEEADEAVDMEDYEEGMRYMSNLKKTVAKNAASALPASEAVSQRDADADIWKIAGDFINECARGQRVCSKGIVMELFQDQPAPFRYLQKWGDTKLYNKVRNKVQALRRKLQKQKAASAQSHPDK